MRPELPLAPSEVAIYNTSTFSWYHLHSNYMHASQKHVCTINPNKALNLEVYVASM